MNQESKAAEGIFQIAEKSGNAEAINIVKEIKNKKAELNKLIGDLRGLRRKQMYKKEELEAIDRLIKLNITPEQLESNKKEIRRLIKLKKRIEFRMYTEPMSLTREKELAKQIEDIEAKIRELNKYVRLEKKKELIADDIQKLDSSIKTTLDSINNINKELDALFDKLRSILGIKKQVNKQRRVKERAVVQNIDIEQPIADLGQLAIIKDKKSKKEDKTN
ncbi:MAG: hypothetical protein ARM1_0356 [Candidatus Micrarchaeota archaeon]|nr:MAG: hypothetical protein ARM1_0356 [Candidatus Micrarchaeota archaeon]